MRLGAGPAPAVRVGPLDVTHQVKQRLWPVHFDQGECLRPAGQAAVTGHRGGGSIGEQQDGVHVGKVLVAGDGVPGRARIGFGDPVAAGDIAMPSLLGLDVAEQAAVLGVVPSTRPEPPPVGSSLPSREPAPPVVGEGQVLVKSIAFTPKEVRATVGQTVTWKFDDGGLEHTVTADDKSFDSGRMSSGTYPKIFNTPGTIPYHCEVHVRMKGTIVVTGG